MRACACACYPAGGPVERLETRSEAPAAEGGKEMLALCMGPINEKTLTAKPHPRSRRSCGEGVSVALVVLSRPVSTLRLLQTVVVGKGCGGGGAGQGRAWAGGREGGGPSLKVLHSTALLPPSACTQTFSRSRGPWKTVLPGPWKTALVKQRHPQRASGGWVHWVSHHKDRPSRAVPGWGTLSPPGRSLKKTEIGREMGAIVFGHNRQRRWAVASGGWRATKGSRRVTDGRWRVTGGH